MIAKKCNKCKGTGRIWSEATKPDPDCVLTPQREVSVRSCTCKAGKERSKRLNG